MAVRGSAQEP